jgi:hypothetical protein
MIKMTSKILITYVVALLCFIKATAQKDSIPDSKYYPAKGNNQKLVLLLLGGSEGGLPNYYDVEKLTSLGYSCMILGYFGTKNTPDRLEMIPIEYFEKEITALKSRPEFRNKKLVVWGEVKGRRIGFTSCFKV